MKPVRALSLCLALISGNVFGIQLPLGFTEVPSCTPAQEEVQGSKKSRPSKRYTRQMAAVNAIVEGENTAEPANVEPLQECADAAVKKVDLRFLAAQPGEGNSLFKKIFLQCVEENQLPVNVYFVAVKLDDRCEPEAKNTR